MNSQAQHSEADHNDRRSKRGEGHRSQSIDKSPIYQQELAYAFRSSKKNLGLKNLGNMYTLTQGPPGPKQQMSKNFGAKEVHETQQEQRKPHQYQRPINMKPNLPNQVLHPPSPPRSFKNQYKFMMTNYHQQQQQYHQANAHEQQNMNNQIMDLHKIRQAEPQRDTHIDLPSLPQMPELPQAMQQSVPNLMDPPEQGPIQMYMPMS